MNIFRFAGDMTHLLSILVLLLKIYATKSCSGISLKTQELYALVFVTRYLDLFTDFISVYNTVMKLVFIGSSLAIVWCMRWHRAVKRSYDRELDTFRHYLVIAASLVLALLVHEKFTFQEILWAFSIYLEALAILPQLVLLQRSGNVDNLTGQYVFFLGRPIVHSTFLTGSTATSRSSVSVDGYLSSLVLSRLLSMQTSSTIISSAGKTMRSFNCQPEVRKDVDIKLILADMNCCCNGRLSTPIIRIPLTKSDIGFQWKKKKFSV
ncbi:unnamed protein product [Camellia sinensis]